MSYYNTKNYMAHGGNELVIGGKLTFLPGAEVEGAEGLLTVETTPPASQPKAANLPESTVTTIAALKEDYNALLVALKSAGIMEQDAASGEST